MADAAMAELASRVRARHDEISRALVAHYRDEIVDYAASNEDFLEIEVLPVTRSILSDMLDNIAADEISPTDEQIAGLRNMLVRRPHQGIALPSIQHAFRIFGEVVYAELSACAAPDRPDELRAVVRGGAVIMRFTHEVIRVVTQAYLDELEDVRGDREIVSRSLLDALLAGRSSAPSTQRDARLLGIDLVPQNVVVVARAPVGEEQRPRTLRAAAKALRAELLRHLAASQILVGIREGEVVCLCPVAKPRDLHQATEAAHAAAAALDELGMSVGVGSWHPPAEEVSAAYAEAREAADMAIRTGVRSRAVVYDDVLVDHVLRSDENAGRVIAAALGPLREYDERRKAGLIDTLRAYVDGNFSITRAARALSLHNNTVLYRLDRVRELTGRDPRNPRDIVFLALSLRLDVDETPNRSG
jgi:sugar diacid utilization regulator